MVGSDEETQTLRTAFPPPDARDEFGVPFRFFGHQSEAVWGLIGRTAAVAALLEDHLVVMLQLLTLSDQTSFSKLSPTRLCELLAGEAPTDDPAWDKWDAWLTDVGRVLEERNEVVHSLWPAQAGNRRFAHRMDRKTGRRVSLDTTHEALVARLTELSDVTTEAEKWKALAGVEAARRRLMPPATKEADGAEDAGLRARAKRSSWRKDAWIITIEIPPGREDVYAGLRDGSVLAVLPRRTKVESVKATMIALLQSHVLTDAEDDRYDFVVGEAPYMPQGNAVGRHFELHYPGLPVIAATRADARINDGELEWRAKPWPDGVSPEDVRRRRREIGGNKNP
jgi:hypothetical protein